MMKVIDTTTDLKKFNRGRKCAEVFYQNVDNFAIVCMECEMKSFDFSDFLLHFKNVHHLSNSNVKKIDEVTLPSGTNIKHEIEFADEYASEGEFGVERESSNFEKIIPVIQVHDRAPTPTSVMRKYEHGSYEDVYDDVDDDEKSDETYNEHVPKVFKKKTVSKTLGCPYCSKTYKLQNTLNQHIDKMHGANAPIITCAKCDNVFHGKRDLDTHIVQVHGGFQCDQCNRLYRSKDSLQVHKLQHTGVRSYVCDVTDCGKAFFNRKHLSSHKRLVHNSDRNYVCEICGYRTKIKPSLVVHKRTHTGEKPYNCSICGKGFASRSLMVEHLPIHSQDRPHKCDVCGAAFSRPKALYHHKHLHLDVKRFVCKICGKAYAQAAGLCGHMRQHKNQSVTLL